MKNNQTTFLVDLLGVSSRDLACSSYTTEMQGEGLNNIWMCSEDVKVLDLIRATDYYPIPVGFLVYVHTNKLNRAGPGYRQWHSVVNLFQL